jgi:hypothetical protein
MHLHRALAESVEIMVLLIYAALVSLFALAIELCSAAFADCVRWRIGDVFEGLFGIVDIVCEREM